MNIDSLLQDLGQSLATYRVSRRLKQSDLEELAGVDRTTISRLERGTGTLDTLARVLSALDIADRLLTVVPEATLNPLDDRAIDRQPRYRVRDRKVPDTTEPWSWADDQP